MIGFMKVVLISTLRKAIYVYFGVFKLTLKETVSKHVVKMMVSMKRTYMMLLMILTMIMTTMGMKNMMRIRGVLGVFGELRVLEGLGIVVVFGV